MTRRLETPDEAAARLADARLSERERAELWARVEASAARAGGARRGGRRRALWIAVPAFALAAAVALALLFAGDRAREAPKVVDACALDAQSARLSLAPHCRPAALRVDGDQWLLRGGAEVARTQAGAHVTRGRVRFRVRPRAQAPFRVSVSHGQVRVIGTVFEVSQQEGRGFVTVSEGVIEFVWNDGARERVSAGQTLHWPRRPPQPPEPAVTAADAGPRDDGQPVDLDRVLERLLQLQSQKRFDEAVVLLRGTLGARGLRTVQRERISYELGLALEAGGQPSCAHWLRHAERFGSSGHGQALAERLARCRTR